MGTAIRHAWKAKGPTAHQRRELSTIELTSKTTNTPPKPAAVFTCAGMKACREYLAADGDYSYTWCDKSHYVALHDLNHVDGETFTDDCPVSRQGDLRGRLTFVPSGCRAWGWSLPFKGEQSFTALYLDPDLVDSELRQRLIRVPRASRVYFNDMPLGTTFRKIHLSLNMHEQHDSMYLESLCLLAALELCSVHRHEHEGTIRPPGCLARRTEQAIIEYMLCNLDRDIALDELAALAGLSRFHFSRAFKRTTASSPYRYLLELRVERATMLLQQTRMPIAEIAAAVGFRDSTRFGRTFRRFKGVAPGELRR